jgi:hypothetical protein
MKRLLIVLAFTLAVGCSKTEAVVKKPESKMAEIDGPKIDKSVLTGDFKQDASKYYDLVDAAEFSGKVPDDARLFMDTFNEVHSDFDKMSYEESNIVNTLGRMWFSVNSRLKGDTKSADIVDFDKERAEAKELLGK